MPSKKPKRDEKGAPILDGSITFGTIVKPKNRAISRTSNIKSEAATRLAFLMKHGRNADRLARKPALIHNKDKEHLDKHNRFARASKPALFLYYVEQVKDLKAKLAILLKSDNKRKIAMMAPGMRRELEEAEKNEKEFKEIVANERRVISRRPSND